MPAAGRLPPIADTVVLVLEKKLVASKRFKVMSWQLVMTVLSGYSNQVTRSTTEEDVLNIADLMDGANSIAADLEGAYISIASTGVGDADTTITLYSDGTGPDQVIVLTGYSTAGMSSVDVIDNLLTDGNLITE